MSSIASLRRQDYETDKPTLCRFRLANPGLSVYAKTYVSTDCPSATLTHQTPLSAVARPSTATSNPPALCALHEPNKPQCHYANPAHRPPPPPPPAHASPTETAPPPPTPPPKSANGETQAEAIPCPPKNLTRSTCYSASSTARRRIVGGRRRLCLIEGG